MSDSKKTAYGGDRATDTDFRKTWDTAEYARKAKAEEEQRREEGKARYEAKLEGKKYHKYVDKDLLDSTSARGSRLDVASMIGKSTSFLLVRLLASEGAEQGSTARLAI